MLTCCAINPVEVGTNPGKYWRGQRNSAAFHNVALHANKLPATVRIATRKGPSTISLIIHKW